MPKISELPLANKLKEEDYIPIVQDGVTKKVKGTHFVTEEEYSLDAFSPTIAANDKAMYKFGEGDSVDFSDSAYDGAYKSAILKGYTLVNAKPKTPINVVGTETAYNENTGICSFNTDKGNLDFSNALLKPSTKYLAVVEIIKVPDYVIEHSSPLKITLGNLDEKFINIDKDELQVGIVKKTMTTSSSIKDDLTLSFRGEFSTPVEFKVMILEYQDGMENWDIPYFEGMQNVRMPVLTTTGKNLWSYGELGEFDIKVIENVTIEPGAYWFSGTQSVTYDSPVTIALANADGTVVKSGYFNTQFDVYETVKKVIIYSNGYSYGNSTGNFLTVTNFMMEKDTITDTYEPYKSNILSTPSDLELRGIGNIYDELDLLTGKVTQRVDEVTFNGTEDWGKFSTSEAVQENTCLFAKYHSLPFYQKDTKYISDKYNITTGYQKLLNTDEEMVHLYEDGALYFRISKSKLSTQDVQGFKSWLSQNPFSVQYRLANEFVKTVDLSGTPFGYKGGHIIKSSAEGSLLPKFEYEVAVSRGAQISQNTSTLIKHDEKITELLKKTAATYINQKAEIAHLLNMSNTLEEVQTIPFIEDDYVNDDCMVDSDMVMDDMQVEPEKEIIDNVDTLLINLIYDLIELNDTLDLSEKVELFRQSGLIDKHNYEIIKEKLNPSFKEEDYADINQ